MWYDGEKASVIVLYYLRQNLPTWKKICFSKKKRQKIEHLQVPNLYFVSFCVHAASLGPIESIGTENVKITLAENLPSAFSYLIVNWNIVKTMRWIIEKQSNAMRVTWLLKEKSNNKTPR